jgi:hypothetical protein
MAAMSDLRVFNSTVMFFSISMISELEGSVMVVAGWVEEADEDVGDGRSGGECWGSAAGVGAGGAAAEEEEDRLDRDTRLSSALTPNLAGPRLRSS